MSLTQADTERVLEALNAYKNPRELTIMNGEIFGVKIPADTWRIIREALQQAAEHTVLTEADSVYCFHCTYEQAYRDALAAERAKALEANPIAHEKDCPVPLYRAIANHKPGGAE